MKKHFYYKLVRLGLWQLPLSFVLILISLALLVLLRLDITPYSVFVSGYTRSDGTRVSSYYRRPPGSVPHDRPFEVLQWASLAGGISSVVWFVVIIRRLKKADHRRLFSLSVKYSCSYPQPPPKVSMPRRGAVARKSWYCSRCHSIIESGSKYYYMSKNATYRDHFCDNCRRQFLKEHGAFLLANRAYRKEYNSAKEARTNELRAAYFKKFKEEMENPGEFS